MKEEKGGGPDCRGKASSLVGDGHGRFTPVLPPLGQANRSAEKDSVSLVKW